MNSGILGLRMGPYVPIPKFFTISWRPRESNNQSTYIYYKYMNHTRNFYQVILWRPHVYEIFTTVQSQKPETRETYSACKPRDFSGGDVGLVFHLFLILFWEQRRIAASTDYRWCCDLSMVDMPHEVRGITCRTAVCSAYIHSSRRSRSTVNQPLYSIITRAKRVSNCFMQEKKKLTVCLDVRMFG